MTEIFDDLAAEQDALESVLVGLSDEAWTTGSGAAGWTVADVVLHLAQSEEAVAASVAGERAPGHWQRLGDSVDAAMAALVAADRSTPPRSSTAGGPPAGPR